MIVTPADRDLADVIEGLDPAEAVEAVREHGPVDADVVAELMAVAGRTVQADPDLAVVALDTAEALAAEAHADDVEPAAPYLRARLMLNAGRPDDALELIARSRAAWLALGRPLDAHRTDLGRMAVLDDLGRHEEAATTARSLLATLADGLRNDPGADELTQIRWMQAAASENLGVASGFTGRHTDALDAYRTAEEIYGSVGGVEDLARCRANRGVELVAIGRAVEGLDVLRSATAMFDEAGDRLSAAKCLGHAAEAELLLGLYAASLDRFREADHVLDELGARTEVLRLRLRTVHAYLTLNLVDEAVSLIDEAAPELERAGLAHDLAEAQWLGGVARLRDGRVAEALALLAGAVSGAESVADPALRARALVTASEAHLATGDAEAAQADAEAALATVEAGSWPIEEFHARLRLAQLLDRCSDVETHLSRAGDLADELGLPYLRYPLLVELGRRDRDRGDRAAARHKLQEAIDIVEGLRGLIPDEMLRTSYLEGRTAAHQQLIAMLIEGGRPELETAFDLAEASKARTLDDIMAGAVQPAPPRADVAGSVLARYEADLHAAYTALTTGAAGQSRSQRRAVQDRAVELERTIRLAHLRSEAGPGTAGKRSRAEWRPAEDETVVEYHCVGSRIVAFVWRAGRLEVVTVDADVDRVTELVATWERARQRHQLARGLGSAQLAALVDAATDVLRRLWVAVFAPVAAHLDGCAELLIVPHGVLHAVPFHAIVGPDGPVGRSVTVTMAPSYAVARQMRSTPWQLDVGRSVVVGAPDASAPAVAEEARAVAGALPGAELLLADEATVDGLAAATAHPLDVLHLACHGIHRARNPMFSALRLADRWLTAADVLRLTVPGALVVLSACESGRQRADDHREEAIGLARSFVAAGASAVLVSLWLTDDQVTRDLMHHLYRSLADAPPATALRTAQAAVSVDHPHPADWAPFVVQGGSRAEP